MLKEMYNNHSCKLKPGGCKMSEKGCKQSAASNKKHQHRNGKQPYAQKDTKRM